ncbi:MAG: VCBS repeat-containing protein [Verrucomicrobiales bacterium]|nr:VCBS repeat-containing protein [Verrucomicrobiales bacterium]
MNRPPAAPPGQRPPHLRLDHESDHFHRVLLAVLILALNLVMGLATQAQSPPTITRPPAGLSRSLGDRATLNVSVTGGSPLSYQWLFDGVTLDGATNRLLLLTNLTAAMAGSYTVIVSNSAGIATSAPAFLDVDTTFSLVADSPISRFAAWGQSWGDYDDDGYVDLHLAGDLGHQLFHNQRDGTLRRVLPPHAMINRTYTKGAVSSGHWADFDNDGHLDLFAPVGWGGAAERNHLFRGLGDGTFVSHTNAPVGTEATEGASAAWADFNRDGLLDLFVGNLAADSNSAKPIRNTLYLGQPGGAFVRWRPPGFEAFQGRNYGCAAGDFNADGYPDIALSVRLNGVLRNVILFNQGGADFEAISIGVGGQNYGAIMAGDFDNDGALDLFSTWVNGSGNRLYRNDGHGNFLQLSTVGPAMDPARTLSGAWGDYDNDGDLDLFLPGTEEAATGGRNDALWRNDGDHTFTRVTAGSLGNDEINSESAAWGDVDNDGFLDLAVAGFNSRLYRNNGKRDGPGNSWLLLRLVGTKSNRSAIGAKVRVTARLRGNTVLQFREVGAGNSFGQNDPRLHFGLGDATHVETIQIEWPNGTQQTLTAVAARQILTVTEPDDRLRLQLHRGNDPSSTTLNLQVLGFTEGRAAVETSEDFIHWTHHGEVQSESQGNPSLQIPISTTHSVRYFRGRRVGP